MKKKNGKAPILARITIDDEKVKFGLKTEPTPLIWYPQSGQTEEALQLNRDLDGIKRLDITQSTLNKYDLTSGQPKEFVKMIYVMRQLDITPNYIKYNWYSMLIIWNFYSKFVLQYPNECCILNNIF